MSQPELEFFSTPPSSHVAFSGTAITTDNDGSQDFLAWMLDKSPSEILASTEHAIHLRKLSPYKRKINQKMLEWISSSQKQGLSTPEIVDLLSKKVNSPNVASKMLGDDSKQNVFSLSPKIAKISEYSSSQECSAKYGNSNLKIKNKNSFKYFLNDRSKNKSLILCQCEHWEKLDGGFMYKNKDLHLENYLDSLERSHCNSTSLLNYPKEDRHQFGIAKNRKRFRSSSISTSHTSETDPGVCSGTASENDVENSNISKVNVENPNSKIAVKTKYIVINKKSTQIPAKDEKLGKSRLELNRISAQKYRDKKRLEGLKIEQQELELTRLNIELTKRKEELENEIQKLNNIMLSRK